MPVVEIQIRIDRFCELVRAEINSQVLPVPKVDAPAPIKGKWLEKIECASCSLIDESYSGLVTLGGMLVFKYHDSLDDVRDAGSLQPAIPKEHPVPFRLELQFVYDPSLPAPPILRYDLKVYFQSVRKGDFPIRLPGGLRASDAAIVATPEMVSIRIATAGEPVLDPPVDRLVGSEWIQLIPGALIAEPVRAALERALDEAASDPDLRRSGPARAVWLPIYGYTIWGGGDIVAVEACDPFDVDISIELGLRVAIEFPDADTMKTSALLTWDADSTWCDVLATLVFGVPFGIAFHVAAEEGVSEAILGKPFNPGAGLRKVASDDQSITFEGAGTPPDTPSPEFVRDLAQVTAEGIVIGGRIRPKVAPLLAGSVKLPMAGVDIDCNLRAVGMKFDPAQVVLRNKAGGYVGQPPRVFLAETSFVPAGAWVVATDVVNMLDPHSKAPQTVLTFLDPPGGRLPAGTQTSVFLFTDYGVRWVDLGPIPAVPLQAPDWAEGLMHDYCNSITIPWTDGRLDLVWVDPLFDPDFEHHFEMDPIRLWSVGLRELPQTGPIEVMAIGPDGGERRLGVIEGRRSIALEVATGADETLALRAPGSFSVPAPRLSQSWIFPFASVEPDSPMGASTDLLSSIKRRDDLIKVADPPYRYEGSGESDCLAPGRENWAMATRIDRNTVAVPYRGRLVVGTLGTPRRQKDRCR